MTEVEDRLRQTLRHYARGFPVERPRLEDLDPGKGRQEAPSPLVGLSDRVRSALPHPAPVRPRWRWVGAAVAAAVLVLAVATVGVRLADRDPMVSVMDIAATELSRAVEFQMTLTVDYVDTQLSGSSMSFVTSGVADFSTGEGQATNHMVTNGNEIAVETIRLGGFVYIRYVPTADLPEEIVENFPQRWVRMSVPSATPGGLGMGAGSLGLQLDPTNVVELLSAGTNLEERGTEEIGGVRTTRYLVHVDSLTLRAFFEGIEPDRYERMLRATGREEEVEELREDRPTVEMWIDDDGRLRRLLTEQRMEGANMTVELVITDYEATLRLEPPAEFEVHQPDPAGDSLPKPAPVGARPDGVPDDVASGLPFPQGARLVGIERDGATTTLSLEVDPPGYDPREYAELIGNLYHYPPDGATWRIEGSSTGSSSSPEGPNREWADIKLVGVNWAGQLRVEWHRGDAITLVIEVTEI